MITRVPEERWRATLIGIDCTINDAMISLEKSALRLVMVVDAQEKLLGVVNDGDIRRGMITGLTKDDCVESIVNRNPIFSKDGKTEIQYGKLLVDHGIQQIPIVNDSKRVVGLYAIESKVYFSNRCSNTVMIMAGGLGTRLYPKTQDCPKPMIEIRGKPILEHIISRFHDAGFHDFVISLNYLGAMISDYFGDGSKMDVSIRYVSEEKPLSTAGAISLIDVESTVFPIVVTNGDILTTVNYQDMISFHEKNKAVATMAVRLNEIENPFGVVQTNGIDISEIKEKPKYVDYVNAGVYVMDRTVLHQMTPNQPIAMTSLFDELRAKKLRTIAYPMFEDWIDIGRHADLDRAGDHV